MTMSTRAEINASLAATQAVLARLTPEQFELAARFADEWDQIAFDPNYDTLPLEHFEPKVREIFAFKSAIPAK